MLAGFRFDRCANFFPCKPLSWLLKGTQRNASNIIEHETDIVVIEIYALFRLAHNSIKPNSCSLNTIRSVVKKEKFT